MSDAKYNNRSFYNYDSNKQIAIKKVDSIYIHEFRSLKERELLLGDKITVIFGKNGTMKSSIMGLIVHPFSPPNPDAKDPFGQDLKTTLKQVFKFSLEYDNEVYSYDIRLHDENDNAICENVQIKKVGVRHRVVASGHSKGDGNFSLNTSYLNAKRLFPITQTNSEQNESIVYTDEEKSFIQDFYEKVLQSQNFKNFKPINDKDVKTTLGPDGTYYDFNSISSGEDNLGHIVNTLIGFMRYSNLNSSVSNGILAIDEFESALHPVVQANLFDFLFRWSEKNRIQICLTTHSLYLISHALQKQKKLGNMSDIKVNMISTAFVSDNNFAIRNNIDYATAYKELTLKNFNDLEDIYKVDIICEDELAATFIKRILKTQDITKHLNFITDLGADNGSKGNSYQTLASICKNGATLLSNAIVVFDADVPESVTKKIKNFHRFIKLPDKNNLPLEKAIVYYILELDDSADFFTRNDKEKLSYKQNFSEFGISLELDPEKHRQANVNSYKKWAENDDKFLTYITRYVHDNKSYFSTFRDEFIEHLNSLFRKQLLPEFKQTQK
ncbi:MAG TPA: AAA family ATPase [Tissierellaceae bacterium]